MNKNLLIILGVNGALGASLVDCFSDDHHIIGIDKDATQARENGYHYIPCDFKEKKNISAAIQSIPFQSFDTVKVISCIGLFGAKTFNGDASFDENSLYESVQVNLLGVSHFTVNALSLCQEKNIPARIIIVGSAAAQVGSQDVGYGIAKAGLNGLVISISKSLSSKKVVVIGVNAGIFESKMSLSVSKTRQDQAVNSTHIKRKGALNEIRDFVAYTASSAPDYLSGSILNINGGQYT